MNDKDIEKYCDRAFQEFKRELKINHCIPVMLMAVEVDTDNAHVFNLCSKQIPCRKMVRALHEAIKNCHKEILESKFEGNELN
jgi:hypothetical protein